MAKSVERKQTAPAHLAPEEVRRPGAAVVLGQPEVGRKLGDGRRAKQWTLAHLSEKSGVAVGTLSKVENGKSGASFDTVSRVARALGLRIDDLLSPTSPRFATGRRVISKRGEGVRFGFNSYDYLVPCNELTRKAMVPLLMTICTREVLPPESWASHEGEEYIYVISGSIELHTEYYEPTRLDEGDSVYIDSTMRHAFASVGEADARILSVCLADSLPRLFADTPVGL
ncbi:helix-turn-helix domain-containing protein [Muricoccus aerilatus]|uniref:helix-turn-helix domain-containing protein n=1 Tax=Muricoccus aerilatus TaxID=452982 RepID=UPI00069327C8|nr:XRE family transcriptional regulator [Roseomonas aerilata]